MRTSHALGGLAAALATAAAVHGQTYYVDASAPTGGDGASWNSAFRDLQDALARASVPGFIVKIAQGVYTPDRGSGDRTSSFVVSSGITLMGGFAGLLGSDPDERDPAAYVSVLSGDVAGDDVPGTFSGHTNNCYHVLNTNADATLDGLSIRGGFADGLPSLGRSVGAACLSEQNVRLVNCEITANYAAGTGSICWSVSGAVTLLNCRIVRNQSNGDGIVCDAASVLGSALIANTSQGSLFNVASGAQLSSVLIAGNSSVSGRLLHAGAGPHRIDNCTVVENYAPHGLLEIAAGAEVHVDNSIFRSNHSEVGDVRLVYVEAGASVEFADCMIEHANEALADPGPGRVLQHVVIDSDPMFMDPVGSDGIAATVFDNDYRLRPGSPAIDAARAEFAPFDSDVSGSPRLRDDPGTPDRYPAASFKTLDLGAFEFQGTSCRADWNGSGQVRPDDIPSFIDSWVVLDPRADFNRDGGVSLQDLFDFLSGYFTGCL